MFATLSNPPMRGPVFTSLATYSILLLLLAAGPGWLRQLRPEILLVERSPERFVLTQFSLSRQAVTALRAVGKADTAQPKPDKQVQGPSASVTPGTERWRDLVEEGEKNDLEIVAQGTLPLLQSRLVQLAFDIHRPRGLTYLLDPGSHSLRYADLPSGVVVRELILEPSTFEVERTQAEKYLGSPPHVYALYPEPLFAALKGLTLEALKKSGVQADKVTAVTVRVQLTSRGIFTVTLLNSKGDQRS